MMLTPAVNSIVSGSKASPAILIFVSAPGKKIVSDVTALTELFGFSRAESRLAPALLAGISPPEFSLKAGVTYNTVRTLLARAMARVDARTQLELVLRVASALGCVTKGPSADR